jgi:hypothetical protein
MTEDKIWLVIYGFMIGVQLTLIAVAIYVDRIAALYCIVPSLLLNIVFLVRRINVPDHRS